LEIRERILQESPQVVFINHLKMNNIQKKNLSKAWASDTGATVKILDRFELILQIFAARAKSNLAKYELALAYLHYGKSLVGREGGIPVSYLANIRHFDVLR
jgi:50S ribosomal subunit-associated GTPase HflX